MEMCTVQSMSSLPKPLTVNTNNRSSSTNLLRFNTSIAKLSFTPRYNLCSRFMYNAKSTVVTRATFSEETSNGPNEYVSEERDGAVATKDSPPVEKSVYAKSSTTDVANNDQQSSVDNQVDDFLSNLNLQFDSEDTYSYLLYGGAALVTVWLASAIVGSIDAIPLFPKLMEVVGLGYSFWFTTRYLLFKKNREELGAKVEELKQQVFGSKDD